MKKMGSFLVASLVMASSAAQATIRLKDGTLQGLDAGHVRQRVHFFDQLEANQTGKIHSLNKVQLNPERQSANPWKLPPQANTDILEQLRQFMANHHERLQKNKLTQRPANDLAQVIAENGPLTVFKELDKWGYIVNQAATPYVSSKLGINLLGIYKEFRKNWKDSLNTFDEEDFLILAHNMKIAHFQLSSEQIQDIKDYKAFKTVVRQFYQDFKVLKRKDELEGKMARARAQGLAPKSKKRLARF